MERPEVLPFGNRASEWDLMEFRRICFIYEQQRIPGLEELQAQWDSLQLSGPPLDVFRKYLESKTAQAMFDKENWLWSHMAGENTKYWLETTLSPAPVTTAHSRIYGKLKSEQLQFRVMKVTCVLRDGKKTFSLELLPAFLWDSPAYIAISYTWGNPAIIGYFDTPTITTDEKLGYNQSVFDILDSVVGPGCTRYLWIDAVCINQVDLDERASQVHIMGSIYDTAKQVIIHLGPGDARCYEAMDLLQIAWEFLVPFSKEWAEALSDRARLSTFKEANIAQEINPRTWAYIWVLLSHRWFTRSWVVQEAVLGHAITFVCGTRAVGWMNLSLVSGWMFDNSGLIFAFLDSYDESHLLLEIGHFRSGRPFGFRAVNQERFAWHSKDPVPFWALLLEFHYFESSDPRDKVYSLLGLASAAELCEKVLIPDYRLDVETLYTDLVRYFLKGDAYFLILCKAGVGTTRNLSLSSWVPDWSSTEHIICMYQLTGRQYHVTPGTRSQLIVSSENAKVLSVEGKIVDHITRLGFVRRGPESSRECKANLTQVYQEAAAWIEEALGMVNSSGPRQDISSLDPSMLKDFFWKTLGAGAYEIMLTNSHRRATQRGFDECLKRLRAVVAEKKIFFDELEPSLASERADFLKIFDIFTRNRRFFITANGQFGLTSPRTEVGDLVCVFLGAAMPFVIRESTGDGAAPDVEKRYQLVGEAYVQGLVTNPPVLDDTVQIALI